MLLEKVIEQGKSRPGDVAIMDDRRTLTFGQLRHGSNLMAGHINKLAPDQQRIGLLLPQSSAFAVAFGGVRWSSRVAVPLNYLLRPPELIDICRDAGVKTIFTIHYFDELAKSLQSAGFQVVFMEDLSFKKIPWPRRLPHRTPDDLAVILYTSGTSSSPKGVMLTSGNLDSNAADAIAHAQFNRQMTFLGVLPMFHALGLMAGFLVPLSLGCRVVYQARFSPPATLDLIIKHKIQVLVAVPTLYALLANCKSVSRESMASVMYAISGGEPLPLALLEKYKTDFGIDMLEGFGLTETSPMVSFCLPWAHKPGSVGKPLPNVELRIVDETDKPLGPNQDGELWIRGRNVMKGYLNKPAETQAVLTPDGWFKTGDIARIDSDGFLFITGRKKELIIMAGEKIAPYEIEEVIRQHPAVLLTAVIGIKDPQRGEVPVAFIQLEPGLTEKPTAHDIRVFVRQRLAPYKTPRDVYFLDDMPRSPTGKILKRALRVPAAEQVLSDISG
jgi:long-chain acyl-CoA synthetase